MVIGIHSTDDVCILSFLLSDNFLSDKESVASHKASLECEALDFLISLNLKIEEINSLKVSGKYCHICLLLLMLFPYLCLGCVLSQCLYRNNMHSALIGILEGN